MDVKFGKLRPKSIFSNSLNIHVEENIFASNPYSETKETTKSNFPTNSQVNSQSGSNLGKRINDFDSNILENNAYKNIPDDMLKLEYEIGILEGSLAKLTSEVEALESLGDAIQISDLKERKRKIEEALAQLNKKYSELGLSAKISCQIASAVGFTSKRKPRLFSQIKGFVVSKILVKLSKKFGYNQAMKESLAKLANINANVDELINLQVPYGETLNRYEKLTAYLNKANAIHSSISRDINNHTKRHINWNETGHAKKVQ